MSCSIVPVSMSRWLVYVLFFFSKYINLEDIGSFFHEVGASYFLVRRGIVSVESVSLATQFADFLNSKFKNMKLPQHLRP